MLTYASRVPVAVGLNVTLIMQLALAAMLVPQVLAWEKSPAFTPVMLIPVKFNCVPPTLVSVTFWGTLVVPTCWSPKSNFFVESETTVPVPVNGTASGLAGSELLMANPAFLRPFAVGVKVAEIVQLAFAANVDPQELVSPKSPGSKPPT